MGTAPGIFGLASLGSGADLGPKSMSFGRILKNVQGLFSSAEVAAFRDLCGRQGTSDRLGGQGFYEERTQRAAYLRANLQNHPLR